MFIPASLSAPSPASTPTVPVHWIDAPLVTVYWQHGPVHHGTNGFAGSLFEHIPQFLPLQAASWDDAVAAAQELSASTSGTPMRNGRTLAKPAAIAVLQAANGAYVATALASHPDPMRATIVGLPELNSPFQLVAAPKQVPELQAVVTPYRTLDYRPRPPRP